MKKSLKTLMLIILLVSLSGCGNNKYDMTNKDNNSQNTEHENNKTNNDTNKEDNKKEDNESSNTVGNSINNIQNGGYMAREGDYIYYADIDGTIIYRSSVKRLNGSRVYEADGRVNGINVLGKHIYFVENNDGVLSLIKISIDGKERQVLERNIEDAIYVRKDGIYYAKSTSNDNYNIMKMDLDGHNKEEVLSDLKYYFFVLDGDYLYYDDDADLVYNLKTKESKESKVRTYGNAIIVNGRIFQIHKYETGVWEAPIEKTYITEVVGDTEKRLDNTVRVHDFGVINNKIYYTKSTEDLEGYEIHMCNLDGTDDKLLIDYENASNYFDIGDDYVYYFDFHSDFRLKRIGKNVSQTIEQGNNIHDIMF